MVSPAFENWLLFILQNLAFERVSFLSFADGFCSMSLSKHVLVSEFHIINSLEKNSYRNNLLISTGDPPPVDYSGKM
jgi:hypothetical protein